MRTVAIEEHAAVPELWAALAATQSSGSRLPEAMQRTLNDLGEGRLASMDEAGIDVQVLSMQPPWDEADQAGIVSATRAFNDAVAEAIAAHPTRFGGLAALPTNDPALAASELERSVRELGLHGALIGPRTIDGYIDQERYWPIFECAEGLGVPIYMHPSPPPDSVFEAYYASFGPGLSTAMSTAVYGWHVDTGLHTIRLIVSGVFDRFPGLQVIIGHMGESLPFMLGRVEERFAGIAASLPAFAPSIELPVGEYFRRNISITTSGFFTAAPLMCSVEVLGIDRILFAVDYPFSLNIDGRRFLDELPLSPADAEKLAHGNADRLLRLPTT